MSLQRILQTALAFALVCVFVAEPYSLVFAEEYSSTNFMVSKPGINSFGGSSTSTSFSAVESDGQTSAGNSTSTNFVLDAGPLYFDSFTPKQQNWRWYDDETNETPVTALASENVAPANIADDNKIKLRVAIVDVAGIGGADIKMRLQFATTSDFSEGYWDVAEISNCVFSSVWCYADGAGTDNGIITTKVLSDTDACVASVGNGCGTHNESGTSTATFVHTASSTTEYEFTLEGSGTEPNTVYFFRLFNNTSSSTVPLNDTESHPSLSSTGAELTFTIGGLPAATVTSGTTTTIDTTSTSVPFGVLTVNSSALGAHRLTVSTNAGQGYRIFSIAQQSLLGSVSSEIPPVAGTNASPVGWSAGCTSSVSGCYGYHTNEALLSTAPTTRFAADNTFAQFSTTTPEEVAHSAGPVLNKETDIVYKVEVHDDQTADDYSTSIMYIVVPTF